MFELVLAVLIVVSVGVTVVASRTTRRRRKEFEGRFWSYEEFAAAVDAGRIRAVREEKGEVPAIKAVRTDFPGASLQEAKRYVDELD